MANIKQYKNELNEALILCQSGRLCEAKKIYSKLLKVFPVNTDVLTNLGTIELHIGSIKEGIELLRKSLAIDVKQPQALSNLSNALMNEGLYDEALKNYEQAILINPGFATGYFNHGRICAFLKKYRESIASYDRAIQLDPRFFQAFNNRGISLNELRQYAEAIASYDRAIELKPDYAEAYYNRGMSFNDCCQHSNAIVSFNKAIQLDPRFSQAFNNRGISLNELGQYAEAIASYDRAIELKPDYAEAYYNRGAVLVELGKYREAIASYDRAIELKPDYVEVYNNRGIAFSRLNHLKEALADYTKAISINFNYAEAHYNLSQLYLNNFDYSNGWFEYHWRFLVKSLQIESLLTNKPRWEMGSHSQKLYVWSEQGVGDQILYGTMLNDLQKLVQAITVGINKKLLSLFTRSFPKITFVDRQLIFGENDFDEQISMGDLGQYLRPNLKNFEFVDKVYLISDKERSERVRESLSNGKKTVCGLSWHSKNPKVGASKSFSLELLSQIFDMENLFFLNLQYGDNSSEIAEIEKTFGIKIHTIDEINLYDDVDGLASIIEACDFVVTVSNTTAHLAGALGKETLLLVPCSTGKFWYWNDINGKSLWYPSVKIFKQNNQGDWSMPLAEVKKYIETKYG